MCIYLLDVHLKYFSCIIMICYKCFPFDAYIYVACQIISLMMVLKSGIKLRWLMHLVVQPKEFISGKLVNTCSVRGNSCKCWIDTLLILPKLSWTPKALSESFLQILKLGLHLELKVSLGVWFLERTMPPPLKFVLLGSLMEVAFYLIIFKFSITIM